jgi:hypothetical protein
MKNSIISRYQNGEAFTKIAKDIGKSANFVRSILVKNQIKIRDLSQSHEIYSFDKGFFKKIDTEQKAYILGFLYADGNVCKNVLQVCLHKKDIEILTLIKTALQSNHPIVNDRGYVRFRIGNKELTQDLIKLGLVERKTFILKFPTYEIVPKELRRHFIRGYFDGDGCVKRGFDKKYKNQTWAFELISCLDFLAQVNYILKEEAGLNLANLTKEKRRSNPIYYLRHGGTSKRRVSLIYEYLYQDSEFFLTRKKEKFDLILNHYKTHDK